ncbi:2Fe-2S iron-sulfur cluster-binding protein [Nevskia sp.]|uniref:2Fe-2S iron-sulfur cluster-binding protein n=1 Tax=Nevskia sp. TaxID=1929292 RepID=UPI0025CE4B48|nr:2Fe-2S iron-sulfur cluster-binding protein [Nevskia sp.]
MPKATFISADDTTIDLDVVIGSSLMQAATSGGISGIVGDCGGAMACATCHVFVDPAFLDRVPAISDNEDQMLDATAAPRQPNSRLSCQLVMNEALDGIVVRIADPQV